MKNIIILFLFILIFPSCASILNGRYQKVTINSEPTTTILIDGKEAVKKNNRYKLKRDLIPKIITAHNEGYEDENILAIQYRTSPWHTMSIFPFGILIYPAFFDIGEKSKNYDKEYSIISKNKILKEIKEKEIQLNDVIVEYNGKNFDYKPYYNYEDYKNNENEATKLSGELDNSIQISDTAYSNLLDDYLIEKGFYDTSKIDKKNTFINDLYININIKNISMKSVFASPSIGFSKMSNNSGIATLNTNKRIIASTLEIEWEILDYYKSSLYKQTITSNSDDTYAVLFKHQYYHKIAIKDALRKGFLEFMRLPQVQEFINKEADDESSFEIIALNIPTKTVSNLSEAIKSSVTIKENNRHGSGFIISNDGYIVTNYHVISNSNNLVVQLSNGKEFKANVIRKSKIYDLALLKIDTNNLTAFNINNNIDLGIASLVYAIGTPSGEDLSQSISKGIVSGFIEAENGSKLIQTDASVNGGNSGGPLINKEGIVIGVVNSKLIGLGIEGIAFGIPAYEIGDKLKIEFK